MNRKQFIESLGATCDNWNWSWSFINRADRTIIFGAWDKFAQKDRAIIFSEKWRINRRGRKSPGFDQSREHIRLIEEEGYTLKIFPMEWSENADDDTSPAKIKGFKPETSVKLLIREGDSWYAVDSLSVITPLAEELPKRSKYVEGLFCQVTINAYERNPKARAACIAHHGPTCAACKFNFAETYGEMGKGFIHVHHIVPIGSIRKEYEIDPINDLIPVCPNCHAMLHRVDPPHSIQQIRENLRMRSK
jgi:5-methylcytosine-specific restriction protein A